MGGTVGNDVVLCDVCRPGRFWRCCGRPDKDLVCSRRLSSPAGLEGRVDGTLPSSSMSEPVAEEAGELFRE